MNQNVLLACLPWAIVVIVAVIVARMLIWWSGAKLDLGRLRRINQCQDGAVQSLAFVLTLPFFVMIVMLIVQATHIMMANIVVHYSAFAAVRSAVVWIPANATNEESANCISTFYQIDSTIDDEVHYEITPDGTKYSKIKQAAVLAVMPMGPSRNLGYTLDSNGQQTGLALGNVYQSLDPDSISNGLIRTRLENKLAYSYANTDVRLRFWHQEKEEWWHDVPLQEMYGRTEYEYNEMGWQDHISARVTYNLPLLPGPVRLFARQTKDVNGRSLTDASGQVYIWSIAAEATMGNEGEKPLIPYWQEEYQWTE